MKNIKEFRPLIKLIGEEKKRLVIASILIFIVGLSNMFTGYLNGAAVEAITKLDIIKAFAVEIPILDSSLSISCKRGFSV